MSAELGMFDAALSAAARTEADLENLALFGVRGALAHVEPERRHHTAADTVSALRASLSAHRERLARAGVGGLWSARVSARRAPRRSLTEIWTWLAREADVDAIGPVSTEEPEAVVAAHAQAAALRRAPLLLSVRPASGGAPLSRALSTALAWGVPGGAVVVVGCDFANVRAALAAACWTALVVGPLGLSPEAAAELLSRYGRALQERSLTTFGYGASIDVTAPARFREAATRAGVDVGLLSASADRFQARLRSPGP